MSREVYESPHSSHSTDGNIYKRLTLAIDNEGAMAEQVAETTEDDANKKYVDLNVMNYTLIRCESDTNETRGAEYALVTTAPNDATHVQVGNTDTIYIVNNTEGEPTAIAAQPYESTSEPKSQLAFVAYEEVSENVISTEPSLLAKVIHEEIPPIMPRKRRTALPPPHELLASPDFRLYLYSCRLCHFKCNAIKELSQHKKTHTGTKVTRVTKTTTEDKSIRAIELIKRIKEDYQNDRTVAKKKKPLVVDCFKCAACGFETSDGMIFSRHIIKHNKLK